MSLFSYIDTSAPSKENILAAETEYDENGNVKEPTWVDKYELETEYSLQRLSSTFGFLSIIFAVLGVILSIWLALKPIFESFTKVQVGNKEVPVFSSGVGTFTDSLITLIIGFAITALVFAALRLARAFVSYMLVRLLQTEED